MTKLPLIKATRAERRLERLLVDIARKHSEKHHERKPAAIIGWRRAQDHVGNHPANDRFSGAATRPPTRG